jgi:hypothetical protein
MDNKEFRKVMLPLRAQLLQSSASLVIPAGETIEKAPYGHVSGSKDGFGGLWVRETDFEANTEPA